MNVKEYQDKAKSLRHLPMVEAWIAAYRADKWNIHEDCKWCGWPHNTHLLCNQAPFGVVVFGRYPYSVSMAEVVWWVDFMESHAPAGAFHWRDQKFFRRTDAGVEITFFTPYNNTPQRHVWVIPQLEWESITASTQERT